MYAENSNATTPLYTNSTVLFVGKNILTIPNTITPIRRPKSHGIHPVKSYFVWHANSVSAKNMPRVMSVAWITIGAS